MQDWQQRVIDERDELDQKLIKLQNFLVSSATDRLSETDLGLLKHQAQLMLEYTAVLPKRIERF